MLDPNFRPRKYRRGADAPWPIAASSVTAELQQLATLEAAPRALDPRRSRDSSASRTRRAIRSRAPSGRARTSRTCSKRARRAPRRSSSSRSSSIAPSASARCCSRRCPNIPHRERPGREELPPTTSWCARGANRGRSTSSRSRIGISDRSSASSTSSAQRRSPARALRS